MNRFIVVTLAAFALSSVACGDPLARLDQVKQAFADEVAGRSESEGVSLGAGHAKRMYYQFIDGRGQVRFVERVSDVPEAWRGRVGFVEMDSPPPLSPEMAENTRKLRFAAVADKYRKAAPAKPAVRVVLYSAEWCGWCKKAKRHLDRKGVEYELRDIDSPQNLEELVAKTGQRGIPVLDVGGRVVTGFSPEQYDSLL
jgi:glutaredoxin